MNTRKPLIPAQLHWRDDTPEAVDFGDIYFSRDNGLAESRHVFLDSNNLRERWRQLPPSSNFVIAETGFGTGLNFLLAWQLWLDTAPPDATLFFISTELHPLTHADLQRALSHWDALSPLSAELLQHYPNLLPGFHVVRLAQGRGPYLSRELIEEVVATNDKQRFALSEDGRLIRANQGHSIAVDLGLAPQTPPALLYHGTADKNLPSIMAQGLLPGRRQHVHLSANVETAVKVGQRHGRPIVLKVQTGAMHAAGHLFYKSANGVWLVAAVPAPFIAPE